MDLMLVNKVAIITGCRGICKEIALTLAEEGANVVMTYITEKGKNEAEDTIKRINTMNRKAMSINMNLLNLDDIREMVETVSKEFGIINILVNCAGDCISAKAEDFTNEQWDNDIGINLKGLYFCCKETFNKAMKKQKEGGNIINIASIVGMVPIKTDTVYDVAKAGVIHLTRQLALEWGPYNIRVNSISPGWIITKNIIDRVKNGTSAELEPALRIIPLGRFGEPKDIANLTAFLCSDKSKFITGENIVVDGGMIRGIRLTSLVNGKIETIY